MFYHRLKKIENILKDVSSVAKVIKAIRLRMKFHDKMHDTIISINKYFSLNCLLVLLQIVAYSTFSIFALYDTFMKNLPFKENCLFITTAFQLLIGNLSVILVLLHYISLINHSQVDAVKCLTEIEDSFEDRKVHQMANLAILQIKSLPLVVTSGLTIVDWKITLIIISAIFQYILILIQFDVAGNDKAKIK
jgi:hypothetical protein